MRGDQGFERLYEEHRGAVYRFVLGRVRNRQEAEDVTQHAFLDAFRALDRGNRPLRPRPWLLAIAANVVRRRRRRAQLDEVPLDELSHSTHATEVEATVAEIRAALEALPPAQREVFVLREVQGRRAAEVAEQLGMSVPAVEMLLFRARRGFRAHFEEERPSPLGALLVAARLLAGQGQSVEVASVKIAAAAVAVAVAAGAVGGSSNAAQPPPQPARVVQKEPVPAPTARRQEARVHKARGDATLGPLFAGSPTLPERVKKDSDEQSAPPPASAPAPAPPPPPAAASPTPEVAVPQLPLPVQLPVTTPTVSVPVAPATPVTP